MNYISVVMAHSKDSMCFFKTWVGSKLNRCQPQKDIENTLHVLFRCKHSVVSGYGIFEEDFLNFILGIKRLICLSANLFLSVFFSMKQKHLSWEVMDSNWSLTFGLEIKSSDRLFLYIFLMGFFTVPSSWSCKATPNGGLRRAVLWTQGTISSVCAVCLPQVPDTLMERAGNVSSLCSAEGYFLCSTND